MDLDHNVGRENGPWSDDFRRNAALLFADRQKRKQRRQKTPLSH
jgi:hypothetical protein